MLRADKEMVVAELVERLRRSETLIVTDYRGLTMGEIDDVRTKLIEAGARFSVVKNTLTRRAAEAAGVDELLALLEGPTAIAFLEPDSDPVAAAKVLNEVAKATKILTVKGGVMEGRAITESDVTELASLPPVDVLRGQVLGAIIGPLTGILGLVSAPLQDLYGLIDARIDQLAQAEPEQAVRDSGPVEGDSGEPGGSPAPEAAAAPETTDENDASEPDAAEAQTEEG